MKKTVFLFALLLICTSILFAGCGNREEEAAPSEDNGYYPSSLSLRTFSEVAGENVDATASAENATVYTYEIKDNKVGAAAYKLYKDYLDENFTYSPIDSTVSDKGYTSVYTDAQSGKQIIYTEAIDQDGIYTVTVTVPE